jgi:hypothetical protein
MLKWYGFNDCIFIDWGAYFGWKATLDIENIKDEISKSLSKNSKIN